MAYVHQVFSVDDPSRKPYVLKILKPWQARFERKAGTPERQRGRFVLEASALRALGEAGAPGLVEVVDAALQLDNPYPWYVMPLYPLGALDEHLVDLRGDVERILAIVVRVANTLAWMHGNEPPYVHRDVHIGNIFLTDWIEPVLGDFGLVHVDDRDEALVSLPTDHFGPNLWRPPELEPASGDTHNPKSDVFLLGGVLYQTMSGGKAFRQTQHADRRFTHEEPGWTLTEISSDPRVPHVQHLLRRMLARDPSERFTARQCADACELIRTWSPEKSNPIVELPVERLREAVAAHLSRRAEERLRAVRDELYATCATLATGVAKLTGPVAPYTRVIVDANRSDVEADRHVTHALPDTAWAAVRVMVDFEPPWERRLWLTYVMLVRNLASEERVVLLTEDGVWTEFATGLAGDPRHGELLRVVANRELNRMIMKLAEQLSQC